MRHDFARSGPLIAIGGLAVAAFLYGYSAIAMPGWLTSAVLPTVWVLFFVLACLWFSKHPYRVMALPALAIVVWFAAVLSSR